MDATKSSSAIAYIAALLFSIRFIFFFLPFLPPTWLILVGRLLAREYKQQPSRVEVNTL